SSLQTPHSFIRFPAFRQDESSGGIIQTRLQNQDFPVQMKASLLFQPAFATLIYPFLLARSPSGSTLPAHSDAQQELPLFSAAETMADLADLSRPESWRAVAVAGIMIPGHSKACSREEPA